MGSGKTSIAQTLAQIYSEQNTLAANYFFEREKRNKIAPLVRSLTRSMCALHKAAGARVKEALQDDPGILDDSTTRRYQFRKLLLDIFPTVLQAVRKEKKTKIFGKTRLVLVIDGIDGCVDLDEMREFVEMLVDISSTSNSGLSNVCILLTGRIGDHFEQTRHSQAFRQIVKMINLENIETTKDIRKYFQRRLSIKSFRIESSDKQLRSLVALSKGSFHFAHNILRYLDKETSTRLSGLLENSNDRLYVFFREVLDHTLEGEVSSNFKEVLGTVTYLNSPLSVTALRRIFTSRQIDPLPSLFQISALLSIPTDDRQPIQPICESLWEYLKASTDSRRYCSDGLNAHFSLASSCLEITAQLSNGDRSRRAEAEQYASVYWFGHLLKCIRISKSGRLKEIMELMGKSNELEENISILLDSSKFSFVLWTNILILKVDDTQKILEDMEQLNMSMKVS